MSLQLYFPKAGELPSPFFTIPVSAGQAKEIEQIADWLNLDDYVRRNNHSTYYIRVAGESMQDLNIFDGDLLVVERRESAQNNEIVIAEVNGEFTVKKYRIEKPYLYLVPGNGKYKPRKITKKDAFAIWGIVTFVIHKI